MSVEWTQGCRKTFGQFQNWQRRKNLPDSGLSKHLRFTNVQNRIAHSTEGLTSNHVAGYAEH